MSVNQTAVVSIKTLDGEPVKVRQETLKSVLRGETVDGRLVLVDQDDSEANIVTTTTVVFDDISETPKSIFWTEEVPDDAWRIVTVGFFDETKLVFSHPKEAANFLSQMKPLRSPRESTANVVNIADYRK